MRDSLEVQVWGSLILGAIHNYNGSKFVGFLFTGLALSGLVFETCVRFREKKHRNE